MYVSPLAQDGRRLRVDATEVETNIDYPTNGACWETTYVFAHLIKR
jgi:hypothetical protein